MVKVVLDTQPCDLTHCTRRLHTLCTSMWDDCSHYHVVLWYTASMLDTRIENLEFMSQNKCTQIIIIIMLWLRYYKYDLSLSTLL